MHGNLNVMKRCDGCLCAGQEHGRARLAGGASDPRGQWEYGRLEILWLGAWTIITQPTGSFLSPRFNDETSPSVVQVACKSLGYSTGAQMLVGISSPFAAPVSTPTLISRIDCNGSEASLQECGIDTMAFDDNVFEDDGELVTDAVALVCMNPSGTVDPRCA